MASSSPPAGAYPAPASASVHDENEQQDPFLSVAPAATSTSNHQRFSIFDSQLFALGPNASPEQARLALEAHLAETDRRMEEAGKLGTALVQQRKELTERLKEVEKLQAEEELSPDLRQKLADIEKEYNEVARESARAFLPKQRVPSNEAAPSSPFISEGKSGRRSVSPSKFETQSTDSPSKFSVPNRKLRNQPVNRIHDIEFAAEISTSLIAQVRNLQALLAEKEEELKETRAEKSRLEYETESFQQRVKALDENEHRYKDENWNLETQLHDLKTDLKAAAEREKKLTQNLNLLQAEKNATQQKLDEVRLSHSKLVEEHAAAVKRHDIELGTAKRNIVLADSERGAMQRKIDELTSQNQELAKAIYLERGRAAEREQPVGLNDEVFDTANDNPTPEHSPPPSPVKGTPRHSMLETETLKTSLGHAQRTIQSLRTNYHREKTEKLELRRMLHEARDEVEKLRSEPVPTTRRSRRAEPKQKPEFKRPPRLLGGHRTVRSEIYTEDSSWEDQPDSTSPPRASPAYRASTKYETPAASISHDNSDQFETANETSDAAFETADEHDERDGPDAETDDFLTGAEDFSSEDDSGTETESPSKRSTLRGRPPNFPTNLARSRSTDSSASTEDEYYGYESEPRTPTTLPPLQQKFTLRVSGGTFRRPRQGSEDPTYPGSPGGAPNNSASGTPQKPTQSLAAELGDFEDSGNESALSATPSRRSIRTRTVSPPPTLPPLPKPVMVDSGMMTDPLPEQTLLFPGNGSDRPASVGTVISRPATASSYASSGVQDTRGSPAGFLSSPQLRLSTVHSQGVEPLPETDVHATEVAAIRAAHAEQMKRLASEHAAAQAAALESLRAEHADQMRRLNEDHAASEAASIEAVQIRHAEDNRKSEAAAREALTQEIEALKSSYAAQASKTAADALAAHAAEVNALKAAHAEEIDALKAAHSEQLALREAESRESHAAEIEALKIKHLEEIAALKRESDAAHAAELQTLGARKSDELSASVEKVRVAHTAELQALEAKHSEEITALRGESDAAHAAEIDALKATHAAELSNSMKAKEAAHAAELQDLKAKHMEELSAAKNDLVDAHASEIEALKALHTEEMSRSQKDGDAAHAAEIAALMAAHLTQIEQAKSELTNAHTKELESLKATHAEQIEQAKQDLKAAHAEQLDALKEAHLREIEEIKNDMSAMHSRELESQNEKHAKLMEELREKHKSSLAAETAALLVMHSKELESSKAEMEATRSKELSAVRETHAREMESLKSQYAAAHARELEGFKAALAKQVESSKAEGDAAHTQQLEAINAAHAEILEAHKRESEVTLSQALASLKASHEKRMEELRSELTANKYIELEKLVADHARELETVRAESESSRAMLLEDIANTKSQELEKLRSEKDMAHSRELNNLKEEHAAVLARDLEALRKQLDETHVKELQVVKEKHAAVLARELEAAETEHATARAKEFQALEDKHQATLVKELQALASERNAAHSKQTEELKAAHAASMDALRDEQQTALNNAIKNLKEDHTRELNALAASHDTIQAEAIEALKASHAEQLDHIKRDNRMTLSRELDAANARHRQMLESQKQESSAEMEKLIASHTSDLEALRKSSTLTQPALNISAISAVETKPVESTDIWGLSRGAVTISPETDRPPTPQPAALKLFGKETRSGADESPLTADDETRQPPSVHKEPEMPESQRPFKEISTNTDARHTRKAAVLTVDHSSQTNLTAESLERMMLKHQLQLSQDSATTTTPPGGVTATPFGGVVSPPAVPGDVASSPTVHGTRSQESIGSIAHAKYRVGDSGAVSTSEPIPVRRPDSAASGRRSTLGRPPLPTNHREAIEAARTNSSSGGKGTMGPPLVPASAYKTPTSRPRTPINRPLSPTSLKGTPTPRPGRAQLTRGFAEVHSPTKMPARSRQSSVSSFTSEIETRFNIRGDMGMESTGFGPSTDPRMIQAITQTMIGEYLWKYTRKAGRGEMSEKRHRRYFWVHPYTKTLYWSDRDPSTAGRSELRAKSVPIEAVRVVTDDNPMPPGLHRKSLIIISPGRTIKFTCTTGQRHETWFNALSYLLLRTGDDHQHDAEGVAGNITQEDVDEFNPSLHNRGPNTNRPKAPPSLSSYNSRTTRNDSPNIDLASMSIPTLTPTHERGTARPGTLSRLSGYWKSGTISGTLGSLRSRSSVANDTAIYDASEVHDSAEDLRQMIEQQDREADRLENVRACCDGKHDVGTLSHSSKRNRLSSLHTHSHTHGHPGPSSSPTPTGTLRSRT
ncbi:hypothetical protein DL771_009964 [Monosporascus sp. 5C6A]|nr:hypothetical protein DL771_009964 [Monosporascus sp. 5C6A]